MQQNQMLQIFTTLGGLVKFVPADQTGETPWNHLVLTIFACLVQGEDTEDMKHNLEMGETAMQPVPAQTADLSISRLRFMSSPCTGWRQ